MSGGPRVPARSLFASVLLLSLTVPAWAQVKGPNTCFKCHKTLERSAWETTAAFHRKSLEQLQGPKAAAFAAAIGLPGPLTVTSKPGDCVSCHATVVGGIPSVGVSCESCHGPAARYFTPHQEPEFYDQPEAARLGLRDLYNKPAAIAAVCVDCHITPDPRLRQAGHPTGAGFDAGKGIQKMVHWDSGVSEKRRRNAYGAAFYAQIGGEGAKLAARRLASSGAAVPARPALPGAAGRPAASAPAAPAARPGAGAPDPFDWDQPVPELPPDYPSDTGAAAPGAPPAVPAPIRVPEVPRAALARAPSTAPEPPPAPVEPPLVKPAAAAPVASPTEALPPAARAAALRGRGAALLADLLKAKGAHRIDIPRPAPPAEFKGPDAELFRLQDEILFLALEALRKPTEP